MNLRSRGRNPFQTVYTEGGILTADLIERLSEKDSTLSGLTAVDYGHPGERLEEVISRSWTEMKAAWKRFQESYARLPQDATATTETREIWLLPLFNELQYGRLQTARPVRVGEDSFPVSHLWNAVPVHLVGFNIDLDRRSKGIVGAAQTAPHSMVQELLNRSDGFLWGFVSNGRRLRILRDSRALTRQAYLEFDLESMMDGELYADFSLLWMLCHVSRVEERASEPCRLEEWSRESQAQGVKALDDLRPKVESAILTLANGFLSYPANGGLHAKLESGALKNEDFYRQLLRVVYRLLFLFIAEDRALLLDPVADHAAKARYLDYYATAKLRRKARSLPRTPHPDLHLQFKLVCQMLGKASGCPELGLPALGSFLFSERATPDLDACQLANADFLAAVYELGWIVRGQVPYPINYRNLQTEELGSVYEMLLQLNLEVNRSARTVLLHRAPGTERKTTGSYYTHPDLVKSLLDSALDPVIEAAARKPDSKAALLALKVCDPACGSGHFLIAAAHRIARRLAQVSTGDEEPSPTEMRAALRQVISHCVYGVDMNEMAVELCKVALWIESLEPGKPLSFLDQKIQCGNSLLGTTPALLRGGLPDETYNPIEGDDRAICQEFRARNKSQRDQDALFDEDLNPWDEQDNLADNIVRMGAMPNEDFADIARQATEYEQYIRSPEYRHNILLANAWCAAFVWKKRRNEQTSPHYPLTQGVLRRIRRNSSTIDPWIRDEIDRLARQYQFFHWHIAFPDVFPPKGRARSDANPVAGWHGGFDAVIGNPPWERIKLQEKEWFAVKSPSIANAPNAAVRQRMIRALEADNLVLANAFEEARRQADGESHFIRQSGRYPLMGRGDVNTYAIFAETARTIISSVGRVGIIVPSGVATDDTTKFFFQDLVETNTLDSLYDFENRKKLFRDVDSRMKFCLLTIRGASESIQTGANFVFFALSADELKEEPRRFCLTSDEIRLLNPNTQTCAIFRSARDAEITKSIYRRVPVLWREGPPEQNPWGLKFSALFHMANDSHHFRTARQLEEEGYRREGNRFVSPYDRYLPLYEAKMLHQFDHRWATYTSGTDTRDVTAREKSDPNFVVQPRYWVREEIVDSALPKFPEILYRALLTEDEQSVSHVLMLWLIGFHLDSREPDEARRALGVSKEFLPHRSLRSLVTPRQEMEIGQEIQRKYPLGPLQAEQIWGQIHGDPVQIAQELVEAFSPHWLMGWRDITNATNERTVIASFLPISAVGDTFLLMFPVSTVLHVSPCLMANLNSLVLDYAARQKVGGVHLKYHVFKQLPILPPDYYNDPTLRFAFPHGSHLSAWIEHRTMELAYSAVDLADFARIMQGAGDPFRWNEERRHQIRCELDAMYFHLYGIDRPDVDYILETFTGVKGKEEDPNRFGEYRTKRVILEVYDALARSLTTNVPYESPLNPLPGVVK